MGVWGEGGERLAGAGGDDDQTLTALWEALGGGVSLVTYIAGRREVGRCVILNGRGGEGGKGEETYPILEMTNLPAERIPIISKLMNKRIKPPRKLRMSNPKSLLQRHHSRLHQRQESSTRQQTGGVHLIILPSNRVCRREKLARRRNVEDVHLCAVKNAAGFGFLGPDLTRVEGGHFVHSRRGEIEAPCLAGVGVEIEAPDDFETGHMGTAGCAAGSADWERGS